MRFEIWQRRCCALVLIPCRSPSPLHSSGNACRRIQTSSLLCVAASTTPDPFRRSNLMPSMLVEKKDAIGVLTINRPETLNALDIPAILELEQEFGKLSDDA